MNMEHKDVVAELKELNEKGEGVLRFIRFEQEDKDGDITRKGFIGRQEAILIPAHNWKSDDPPLGRGESFEDGSATNFRFKLNLGDPLAKRWYDWLKFDGSFSRRLQQVSYGFSPFLDGQERAQKDGRSIRYLKPRPDGQPGAKLHEVSFVVVGSGNDQGVLDIKESQGVEHEHTPTDTADAHATSLGAQTDTNEKTADELDYSQYPEDRRPPLPILTKWLRLYRHHMPFLRDIRKRDGKEVSPETIDEFKQLCEEMLQVAQQFNIKLLTAALLPTVEEQVLQQQQYDSRHKELTQVVNADTEKVHQQLQVRAEELAKQSAARQARIREWSKA